MKTALRFQVLVFAVLSIAAPDLADAQLRVGVVLGLTGDRAEEGTGVQNGFEYGLSKLDPEVRKLIAVEYEDSFGLPKFAVQSFNALRNRGPIDLVFSVNAPTANALAPIVHREGITLVTICSDPKVTMGHPSVFLFFVLPENVAAAALKFVRERGYKRLGAITALSEGRMAVRDEIERQVLQTPNEVQITERVDVNAEERDFRSILTRLQHRPGIDALLVNLYTGQSGLFAKQYRQSGMKVPYFGLELLGLKNEVLAADGALNGQSHIASYSGPEEWQQAFLRRYPGSSTFAAANAHDVALLIGEIAKAKIKRSEIPAFLHSRKSYSGALGEYVLREDNRFDLPAEVQVIGE